MNDLKTKGPSFSQTKKITPESSISQLHKMGLKKNTEKRKKELESFETDSNVTIDDVVKDFSRIKKAVDSAPNIDNSDKVARLKREIERGAYRIDYKELANKMLTSDF